MVPSHNASPRIQIPSGSNFNQNLYKVVYVSAMHLAFKKLLTELRGFPDVIFRKITVPNRDACSQTVVVVDTMQ